MLKTKPLSHRWGQWLPRMRPGGSNVRQWSIWNALSYIFTFHMGSPMAL